MAPCADFLKALDERGIDHWTVGRGSVAVRDQTPVTAAVTAVECVVVAPRTEDEVASVVQAGLEGGIRLVPRGGGSGVMGAASPKAGPCAVVDLKRVWGPISFGNGRASFWAGTLGHEAESFLASRGRSLGIVPMSLRLSTIGGWVATDAVGALSTWYGRMSDVVTSLTVVDGTATVRTLDWTDPDFWLFFGSEGSLGIITRVEMVTFPAFEWEVRSYVMPSWDAGVQVYRSFGNELPVPAVLRLHDPVDGVAYLSESDGSGSRISSWAAATSARMPPVARAALARLSPGTVLVVGLPADDEERWAEVDRFLASHGATLMTVHQDWFAQREAAGFEPARLARYGLVVDTVEFSVPWSSVARVMEEVAIRLGHLCVYGLHLSHPDEVGTAMYFTLLFPSRRMGEYVSRWEALVASLARQGISFSHHHGVGTRGRPFLASEHGAGIEIMARAARTFDPHGIFGTGDLQ